MNNHLLVVVVVIVAWYRRYWAAGTVDLVLGSVGCKSNLGIGYFVVAEQWEHYKNNHFDSVALVMSLIVELVC